MHLAHQKLFSHLCKDGAIVVIQTEYENLSPKKDREEYTKYPIYLYPLKDIKHLSGKMFIELLKKEFPKLQKIIVGFDFHFGYKASCDIITLKDLFNGDVIVVDEYKIDNIAIHSRVIRSLLVDGNIETANKMLGYYYKIKGNHISGQGLGAKSFVPTINIETKRYLIPKDGVYVTKTIIDDIEYHSISFIGHRETTDGRFAIETHILNSSDNLNIIKNPVTIKFYTKLRDNKKFNNFESLKKAIYIDIDNAKNYFNRYKK